MGNVTENFTDEFMKKMQSMKEEHLQKLADLKVKMIKAIEDRDRYQTAADKALESGAVSDVVDARIIVEKKDQEYGVYEDLMKRAQQKAIISKQEYEHYLDGIRTEFHVREYYGYKKLFDAISAVRSALDELRNVDAEAHACNDELSGVLAATNTTYTNGKNPFEWEFNVSRFIEEPISDIDIRLIKASIDKYASYAADQKERQKNE